MNKHLKTVRNTAMSIVVLLVLVLGIGAAYTWYMGQQKPITAIVEQDSTVVESSKIKHVTPAANVPQGVSIQSLTTPVAPGSNASVIIKTNPASTCVIKVEYDKVASKDSGLGQKVSDDFGTITWAWTVEETVPEGKWPITITCSRGKLSAVVIGDLVVSKKATEEN